MAFLPTDEVQEEGRGCVAARGWTPGCEAVGRYGVFIWPGVLAKCLRVIGLGDELKLEWKEILNL